MKAGALIKITFGVIKLYVVGVIENSQSNYAANILTKLLKSSFKKINILDAKSKVNTMDNLSQYVETLSQNGTEILIILISYEDVKKGFYNNIMFDIVIHWVIRQYDLQERDLDKLDTIEKSIFSRLKNKSYLVINIDDTDNIDKIDGIKTCIINYGFNSKATLTASSIDDNSNKLLICQQRAIKSYKGSILEPQEFSINLKKYNVQNVYNALAAIAVALLFQVNDEVLAKIKL